MKIAAQFILLAIGMAIAYFSQLPTFRRFDFDILLFPCIAVICIVASNKLSAKAWIVGFITANALPIAVYLAALCVGRIFYSHLAIGGFHTWEELVFWVPFYSMAWLQYLVSTLALVALLRKKKSGGLT